MVEFIEYYKGVLTVISGFFIHLLCGKIYSEGVINPYIVSYFREKYYQELDNEFGLISLVIMMLGMAIGMPYGIKILHIVGSARKVLFLCGSFAAFSVYISSYIKAFSLFLIFYAFSYGFFTGIIFYVPVYMSRLYFPDHQNKVTGIILSGNGFSALIHYALFQFLNRENTQPIYDDSLKGYYFNGSQQTHQIIEKVPETIRLLSIYLEICVLIGTLLICYHPQQIGEEQKRLTQRYLESKKSNVTKKQIREIKLQLINCIIESEKQYNVSLEVIDERQNLQNNLSWELQKIQSAPQQKKRGSYQDYINLMDLRSSRSTMPNFQFVSPDKLQKVVKNKLHIQSSSSSSISLENSIQFESEEIYQNEVNNFLYSKLVIVSPLSFLVFFVGLFTMSFGLFINGYIKNIGFQEQYSDQFLTVIAILATISHGVSRIVWQCILKDIGYQRSYTYLLYLNIFLSASFSMVSHIKLLFIIYIFLIQSSISGVLVIFPKYLVQQLGENLAQKLNNYQWYSFTISILIQVCMATTFKPLQSNSGIYLVNTILSLISLLIIKLFNRKEQVLYQDQSSDLNTVLIYDEQDN